jgi:hypothetical protein
MKSCKFCKKYSNNWVRNVARHESGCLENPLNNPKKRGAVCPPEVLLVELEEGISEFEIGSSHPLQDLYHDYDEDDLFQMDDEEDDNTNNFDLSFEFMKYCVTSSQGAGLSDKDVQALLDIFKQGQMNGKSFADLEYSTLAEYKTYVAKNLNESNDGWMCTEITVAAGTFPGQKFAYTQPFFHMDPVEWLKNEWQDPAHKEAFTVDAAYAYNSKGERIFNEPHQCDTWLAMQNVLRQDLDPNGVIAALQLYSDKTLVNRKGLSCHPIRAALLNVQHSTRVRKLTNLGYFPSLNRPALQFSAPVWRLVKLKFLSMAIDVLLQPLKDLSFSGIDLIAPTDGEVVMVYPRLMSYVMDDPEVKDLTCIKAPYCEACWVEKDMMLHIDQPAPVRTEADQTLIFEANEAALKGRPLPEAMHLFFQSKMSDAHPVPSGIWGFAQQQEGFGNSMLCMGYESMHNEDLGIFLYKIDRMRAYLTDEEGWTAAQAKALLTELNRRMYMLPRAGTFINIFINVLILIYIHCNSMQKTFNYHTAKEIILMSTAMSKPRSTGTSCKFCHIS